MSRLAYKLAYRLHHCVSQACDLTETVCRVSHDVADWVPEGMTHVHAFSCNRVSKAVSRRLLNSSLLFGDVLHGVSAELFSYVRLIRMGLDFFEVCEWIKRKFQALILEDAVSKVTSVCAA